MNMTCVILYKNCHLNFPPQIHSCMALLFLSEKCRKPMYGLKTFRMSIRHDLHNLVHFQLGSNGRLFFLFTLVALVIT